MAPQTGSLLPAPIREMGIGHVLIPNVVEPLCMPHEVYDLRCRTASSGTDEVVSMTRLMHYNKAFQIGSWVHVQALCLYDLEVSSLALVNMPILSVIEDSQEPAVWLEVHQLSWRDPITYLLGVSPELCIGKLNTKLRSAVQGDVATRGRVHGTWVNRRARSPCYVSGGPTIGLKRALASLHPAVKATRVTAWVLACPTQGKVCVILSWFETVPR